MIENLFPLGIMNYLLGGLLIGLGISLIFIFTGIVSGTSTFFTSTLSYFSKYDYFQQLKLKDSRNWRVVFTVGMILGALLFTFILNDGVYFLTSVSVFSLVIGGFLIGFGARLSSGCTSGHGICGLAHLSWKSFLAVVTFLSTAIITANLIKIFTGTL